MTDIRERFRVFDTLNVPDQWSDIGRLRLETPRIQPPQAPSMARRLVIAAVALAIAIASFLLLTEAFFRGKTVPATSPSPSSMARSVANGLIAFSGKNGVIWTVQSDGHALHELSGTPAFVVAYAPAFSPDGTTIAFEGYPKAGEVGGGANYDVYTMRADGTNIQNLTTSSSDVASRSSQNAPQWSPDGTRLLYSGEDGLHVMDADGSDPIKVADAYSGVWSPDGSRIAFPGMDNNLYTVAADGTGLTQLTQAPNKGGDEFPSWSRDGSQIAFVRVMEKEFALYSVGVDGTGVHLIAREGDTQPSTLLWSPDDESITFSAYVRETHQWDVFSISNSGGPLHNLTNTPTADESGVAWSPDGTQLAFARSTLVSGVDNTGSFDIYLMNPDGSHARRVTTDAGVGGYDTAWQSLPSAK